MHSSSFSYIYILGANSTLTHRNHDRQGHECESMQYIHRRKSKVSEAFRKNKVKKSFVASNEKFERRQVSSMQKNGGTSCTPHCCLSVMVFYQLPSQCDDQGVRIDHFFAGSLIPEETPG